MIEKGNNNFGNRNQFAIDLTSGPPLKPAKPQKSSLYRSTEQPNDPPKFEKPKPPPSLTASGNAPMLPKPPAQGKISIPGLSTSNSCNTLPTNPKPPAQNKLTGLGVSTPSITRSPRGTNQPIIKPLGQIKAPSSINLTTPNSLPKPNAAPNSAPVSPGNQSRRMNPPNRGGQPRLQMATRKGSLPISVQESIKNKAETSSESPVSSNSPINGSRREPNSSLQLKRGLSSDSVNKIDETQRGNDGQPRNPVKVGPGARGRGGPPRGNLRQQDVSQDGNRRKLPARKSNEEENLQTQPPSRGNLPMRGSGPVRGEGRGGRSRRQPMPGRANTPPPRSGNEATNQTTLRSSQPVTENQNSPNPMAGLVKPKSAGPAPSAR